MPTFMDASFPSLIGDGSMVEMPALERRPYDD
jgi:hypothetical protein